MSNMIQLAKREIRLGFRNPWAYSFLILFGAFSLCLLAINAQNYVQGYSGVTASMLSLILYLLPLMTLFIGSFSLTSEKEDGSWHLLSTYPLGTFAFVAGKYAGLLVVLLTVTSFGYGLMGALGGVIGGGFDFKTYGLFLIFSILLILMFLGAALFIGSLSKNRWQALTISVSVWFFAVIGWQSFLLSFLNLLPYTWTKPLLVTFTFLNPAELVRIFVVVRLGGGSILGPEYYRWVDWIQKPSGGLIFGAVCLIWTVCSVLSVCWFWERGRRRG